MARVLSISVSAVCNAESYRIKAIVEGLPYSNRSADSIVLQNLSTKALFLAAKLCKSVAANGILAVCFLSLGKGIRTCGASWASTGRHRNMPYTIYKSHLPLRSRIRPFNV